MTKEALLQKLETICSELADAMHPAQYGQLRKLLSEYAYHVGMEAMGEEESSLGGDLAKAWDGGWNSHRTQAIARLKALTNQ